MALYNYTARTKKELSFKKGDVIQISSRTNDDWWEATVNGQDGFVPAPYVKIINLDHANRRDSEASTVSALLDPHHAPVIETLAPLAEESNDAALSSPSPDLPPPSFVDSPTGEPIEMETKPLSTPEVATTLPQYIPVHDTVNEISGNVFASIDPTVVSEKNKSGGGLRQHSPVTVRRSGSDRSHYGAPLRNALPGMTAVPGRASSQKTPGVKRDFQVRTESHDLVSEELDSAVSAVQNAFLPPTLPAVKEKQRSQSESIDMDSRVSKHPSTDISATMEKRPSVKDATKLFSAPIGMERPGSSMGKGMISPRTHESRDSFERPGSSAGHRGDKHQPPVTKPKPGKKKDSIVPGDFANELATSIAAAAASKNLRSGASGSEKEVHHF